MAAPVHVQAVSVQSSGTATSLTTGSFTSGGGNLLVAAWGDGGAATYGATPISDNKGNAWTQAVARFNQNSNAAQGQHYAKNIAGGSGHTVTLTATGADFLCLAVEEASGADLTTPLDQHPAGNGGTLTGNPHNAASITPTQANTLAVYSMTHNGSGNNTFADAGTGTVRTSQTSTANMPIALATDTRAGTGAVTEGFNMTANDSVTWAAVVANYIGASSAAPALPPAEPRRERWRLPRPPRRAAPIVPAVAGPAPPAGRRRIAAAARMRSRAAPVPLAQASPPANPDFADWQRRRVLWRFVAGITRGRSWAPPWVGAAAPDVVLTPLDPPWRRRRTPAAWYRWARSALAELLADD